MEGTLSQEQRLALLDHLRLYADLLGMRDWLLSLSPHSTSVQTNVAEADVYVSRQELRVAFRIDITDRPAGGIRHILVHELAHAWFHRLEDLLVEGFAPQLGQPAWAALQGILKVEQEQWCERIATVVAPSLPEFTWGGYSMEPALTHSPHWEGEEALVAEPTQQPARARAPGGSGDEPQPSPTPPPASPTVAGESTAAQAKPEDPAWRIPGQPPEGGG